MQACRGVSSISCPTHELGVLESEDAGRPADPYEGVFQLVPELVVEQADDPVGHGAFGAAVRALRDSAQLVGREKRPGLDRMKHANPSPVALHHLAQENTKRLPVR